MSSNVLAFAICFGVILPSSNAREKRMSILFLLIILQFMCVQTEDEDFTFLPFIDKLAIFFPRIAMLSILTLFIFSKSFVSGDSRLILHPAGTPLESRDIDATSSVGSVYSNVPEADTPFNQLPQYVDDGIVVDFHTMRSIFEQRLNIKL